MKRALAGVAAALLTLQAAPGRAQSVSPRVCDPADPAKCSQALLVGQAAPFSGQLLTPRLAIDLGQKADGCEARLKLEVDREKALAQAQKDFDAQLLDIEREAAQAREAALQKALDATKSLVQPPAWYEQPAAVAAATVVVTTVLFFLAVKTVEATR